MTTWISISIIYWFHSAISTKSAVRSTSCVCVKTSRISDTSISSNNNNNNNNNDNMNKVLTIMRTLNILQAKQFVWHIISTRDYDYK
jgi:hypothetical protein